MNTAEFRKKFVPLTQSLKSEGEKLQAAYTEIHDQYVTLSDEMRTLNEAPPHSSELVVLLRDALDQLAAVRNRNFETFIQPWKNRPLSSREDYRKLFIENFANLPDGVLALQTALLKDHLPAIVKNLPWPNDAPDPTVRNERLAELAKEVAVLSAQMEELHALAKEANMKLSR